MANLYFASALGLRVPFIYKKSAAADDILVAPRFAGL